MKVWRFRFEDTGKIVHLGSGLKWGPWATENEALWELNAEFGGTPELLCYKLVEEDE